MGVETLTGDPTLVLPEFDHPPVDPVGLLRGWLREAVARGLREPYAMVLATVDAAGRPWTRVLLLKCADADGLVFTTSAASRKGTDLAHLPYASATFYWRETLQQLSVAGPVRPLPASESDALFAERPVAAQASTVVSRQSQPLPDEHALRERAAALVAAGVPLARPADWVGYRLRPETVEFWHGSPDRLHRRLRYQLTKHGWSHERLQP